MRPVVPSSTIVEHVAGQPTQPAVVGAGAQGREPGPPLLGEPVAPEPVDGAEREVAARARHPSRSRLPAARTAAINPAAVGIAVTPSRVPAYAVAAIASCSTRTGAAALPSSAEEPLGSSAV